MNVHLAMDRVKTAVHVPFTFLVKVCMTSMLMAMPRSWLYTLVAVLLKFNVSDMLGHYAHVRRMTATLFVQPLDLVKNRMQISGKSCLCCLFVCTSVMFVNV